MRNFVLYGFCLYSLILISPYLNHVLGAWTLLPVSILGSYFVISIGLVRHDFWHGYDGSINNDVFHDLCSYIILSDSNCYRHAHASHHKNVHTVNDLEIYGPDYGKLTYSQKRRRFIVEMLLGNIHWEVITGHYLKATGAITTKEVLKSLLSRALALIILSTAVALIYGVDSIKISLISFGLSLWLGAVISRHLQWMQHLGIFINNKDPRQRSLATRALDNSGITEKIFNSWTSTEGENHIIHHSTVQIPISRLRQMPLPEGSPSINFLDYISIARSYLNNPEKISQEESV